MPTHLAIVSNQGIPVEVVICPNRRKQKIIDRLRMDWGLGEEVELMVLDRAAVCSWGPGQNLIAVPASVVFKKVKAYADKKNKPVYLLSVIQAEVGHQKEASTPAEWKFCPDCGCSWLLHLHADPSLEPEDWTPTTCTNCGCKKAVSGW